jgi:hypothetical protein
MKKVVLIFFSLILVFSMLGFVSAQTCTDSDNGINYHVQGSVNKSSFLFEDRCEPDGLLKEYYCQSNDEEGFERYKCPNGCSNGACLCPTTKCSDGTVYGPEKCKIENNVCVCPACIAPKPNNTQICTSDADCPSAKGLAYCKNEQESCGTVTIYRCESGSCVASGGGLGCNMCENGCSNGACNSATTPACIDSDGGKDIYTQGTVKDQYASDTDYCTPVAATADQFTSVREFYCDNGKRTSTVLDCPSKKCQNGACVKGEEISEQVTCIFKNSNKEEKCYTAYNNDRAYCSGFDSCVTNIKGYNGEQIMWKSTCGQYQYTIQDGQAEKIEFECSACQSTAGKCYDGTPIECKIIDGNCVCSTCPGKLECKDSDGGKEIYKKGTTYGLDWGTNNKVEKTDYCITEGEKAGRLAEYFCQWSNGAYQVASESFGPEDGCYSCFDGACQQIIVKPVCGNGICESGEGDVCACAATKTSCEEGKECKVPACVCSVSCPQDCKKTEGIYAKLNEKFKLQVYQPVKITENENHLMKITFKDLIAYKCKEEEMNKEAKKAIETKVAVAEATITGRVISEPVASSGGGGGGGGVATTQQTPVEVLKCVGAGPKALLNVEMTVNEKISKQMVLNLDLEEKKQIDEFTISFLGYDYASRTGIFFVTREIFSCKKGCKCDGKGRVIECQNETCKEGKILCPDGTCREKCSIITEDCKFGCMYEGKCFPMGVRSKGLYCSGDLVMSQQQESDKTCENNFECSSNVCVAGKCISEGLIQKILSWFKRMFGGG